MTPEEIYSNIVVSFKNFSAFHSTDQLAVLSNINFNFKKGQKYFIIGKHGSGKSSLLFSLLDEIPITQGNISINGKLGGAN